LKYSKVASHMRIGINTLFLIPNRVGGTETIVRGLIYGLSKIDTVNEYVIFTNQENHETFQFNSANFTKILCNIPPRLKLYRVFWEQIVLPTYVKKNKIELLHSPGYVSPIKINCKTVVTIPDMQYRFYPQYFGKSRLWYWRYFIPRSARKAAMITTLSEYSKKSIIDLLHISSDKVAVTYPASKYFDRVQVDNQYKQQILDKYGIKKEFILSVASFLPHKNLGHLIESFNLLSDRIDYQLVLVGLQVQGAEQFQTTLWKENMESGKIRVLGYIPEEDLMGLYQSATVFVLPSLFEGFGMPLLEAMSFGCPVAASNKTCIPEIVGNAGILFDPESTVSIADALYSIISNQSLRDDLVRKGFDRVTEFTWEKMAHDTCSAYTLAYKKI
jgi:glycosyltransferase involved in cell wall biosynthesis